ncbi:hypothetical protein KKH27_13425 [bacterium]|nr:hypothetical protein [bacterium]MBU1984616.1 hypothetical protein [bacterium]
MIALLLVLFIAAQAMAQAVDPASLGRAGTHDLRQKSAGVLGWNPAALGPDRGFRMSFELPSMTGSAGNNAFSVSYWNKNVAGDRFLTEEDKNEILGRIPGDKLRASGEISVPVVGFTYNRFGARVSVESYQNASLPKELAELALNGNELFRQYGIGKFDLESQTVADVAMGFGYRFDQEQIPDLHFGIGFHYYQGLYLAEIAEANGNLTVTDSLITGMSVVHSVQSNRGDGVGFDLSALAALSERWEVGLALRQIGARLAWNVDDNHLITFYTDSAGVLPDSLTGDGSIEDEFHYRDTTYSGGTYDTRLPMIVQANGLFRATPKWTLMGDVTIRTESSPRGPSGIQLSGAGEYMATRFLPLYGGLSLGGPMGWRFGLGAGLRTRTYELDIGWTWNGGLFNSAHGIGVGLAQRLKF